jgi:hypothetical protein
MTIERLTIKDFMARLPAWSKFAGNMDTLK